MERNLAATAMMEKVLGGDPVIVPECNRCNANSLTLVQPKTKRGAGGRQE